jgi:hypothetical protein
VHCSSSRPWPVPLFSSRQLLPTHARFGGTDPAARGGLWLDYAEHATVLALAGVLAASRGPGCRILRGLCSAVWLYLGVVAALVLPHHLGSWGASAAPLHCWSASVSASPPGVDPDVK